MIRVVLALWFLSGGAVLAQTSAEPPMTTDEVVEMVQIIETMVVASGDHATVEAQSRDLYGLVVRDFGPESREALLAEHATLLAVLAQSHFEEALGLSRSSLEKAMRLLTREDPLIYRIVSTYALALLGTGEGDTALGLLAEALADGETALAPADPALIEMRLVLANIAGTEGQLETATQNYQLVDVLLHGKTDAMSLGMRAVALQSYAQLLADHAAPEDAIPVLKAAIAAMEDQMKDIKHPKMVPVRLALIDRLAGLMISMEDRAGAEALLGPELQAVAAHYGADSTIWADLAFTYASAVSRPENGSEGQQQALSLIAKVVAVQELAYAPDTKALLDARLNYALVLAQVGRIEDALAQIKAMNGAARPEDRARLTYVLHAAQEAGVLSTEQAVEAVLTVLQESQRSGAAAAQRLLAARLSAGTGQAGALLRQRTDLQGFLRAYQAELASLAALPVAERDAERLRETRSRLGETMRALDRLETDLRQTHPALAAVTGNVALSLAEIRRRLGPDAALVLIDPPQFSDDPGLIVAVSAEAVDWHTFQVPGPEVTRAIAALRAGIDLRLGVRGAVALDQDPAAQPQGADFDLATAHWLYTQLVGQVGSVTDAKALIYFDLRGAISALPPQILVMTPPQGDDPADADWLIRHHAVTILPALSALPDAARLPPPPPATLLAYGDPDFGTLSAESPALLRGSLSPLPETAEEVRDVARALGAGTGAVHLGADASEARLKAAALDKAGMLYFATHGLIRGDQVGEGALAEPALALTPGGGEDGFLTASEIAELPLNAGLVVLSACNTAAGDSPGADSLSGLAQSFLYAGARGLLVSHWPVESRSAVALMTDLFSIRAAQPTASLALAQQQAMLRMIDSPTERRWSHPAYWAPFVVVGSPQ